MSMPDPLVPAGCTMSGNDWFPLHFDRLRKSKWWRRASDLARARNVMLWGEAYKQVPAGSMPDDDDDLAEAAGFGMDVDAFLNAKAEIMAPWVLCSDGRWYHPTVCEVVLDAWERTSARRKADAAKKAAQRAKTRGQAVDGERVPHDRGLVPDDNENVPRDIIENAGDIDTQTGQTRQDRTTPPLPPEGEQAGLDLDQQPAKPKRRKPALPIPENFPDEAAITEQQLRARSAGADLDLAYQAERFRNWAVGRDMRYADWPATWRNWASKAIREAPKSHAPAAAAPANPGDPWRSRVREFVKNRYWNRLDWGPPPGREGCQAPPEILREFGIEPAAPRQIQGAA